MVQQITPSKAKELLSASSSAFIADVRDRDSYLNSHIDGAIHFTVQTLQEVSQGLDKNTFILVYCYHGISSQAVAKHLMDQGFLQVYSLAGGFEAWKMQHSASK